MKEKKNRGTNGNRSHLLRIQPPPSAIARNLELEFTDEGGFQMVQMVSNYQNGTYIHKQLTEANLKLQKYLTKRKMDGVL